MRRKCVATETKLRRNIKLKSCTVVAGIGSLSILKRALKVVTT